MSEFCPELRRKKTAYPTVSGVFRLLAELVSDKLFSPITSAKQAPHDSN